MTAIDQEHGRNAFRCELRILPPSVRCWDLFCKVVDNFGDIGTCWRLAQQLAYEYRADVRLWVDDLKSFSCLIPSISVDAREQRVGPIEVRHWPPEFPHVDVADVVIEAFACELPESYITAMALREVAPVWINLEYLSAESWVEDCHLLTSPHPKYSLTKHFFFPGFTFRTGGLLRENTLLSSRASFDAAAAAEFWKSLEIPPRSDNELRVSLFCYDNPQIPELLQCWADGPEQVLIFVSPGTASDQVARWFGHTLTPGTQLQQTNLTAQGLPFIPQSDYDRLLWACDVNFVRGEESFVRAQWAQKPFVWQIYPQAENAHLAKLDAFLTRYLSDSPEAAAVRPMARGLLKRRTTSNANDANCPSPDRQGVGPLPEPVADARGSETRVAQIHQSESQWAVRRCFQAWNGSGEMGAAWRDFVAIRGAIEQHAKVWARQLDRTGNLADNLVRFVRGK